MRKTTEYKAENRLTVDIEGLMAMLSCGEVTAKKIADYAEEYGGKEVCAS